MKKGKQKMNNSERTLDNLQKGDVMVKNNFQITILGIDGDAIFGEDNYGDIYRYTPKEIKDGGFTLKPTPQPKWEPKEGEEVWIVYANDVLKTKYYGQLDDPAHIDRVYPLTHRQQAQEALERVLEVLKDCKEKNL
jgi:hypothetical protein